MTLQEIENLQLDNFEQELRQRISEQNEVSPESVTLQQILIAFEAMKAQLTAEEELRLAEIERQETLKQRVIDLGSDIYELVNEYLKDKEHNGGGFNPAAFDTKNIENSNCGFWNFSVSKPTLEQLEVIAETLENLGFNKDLEKHWDSLRSKRNEQLKATDFSQLADAPLTSSEKTTYREYRTYLRNLPQAHTQESIASATVMTFEEFNE